MKSQAISSIVATLLLVGIAVSLSIIVFMWTQGLLSNSQQAASSTDKSSNSLRMITIESVALDNQTKTVIVTVRNIGLLTVHIVHIEVENAQMVSNIDPAPICNLAKNEACKVPMFYPSYFHFRDNLKISAYTSEGVSATTMVFVDES